MQKPRPEAEKSRLPVCAPFAQEPARLLDLLLSRLGLSTDSSLAYTLGVTPPLISKIRNRRQPLGPALLLRILEITDSSPQALHQLLQRE